MKSSKNMSSLMGMSRLAIRAASRSPSASLATGPPQLFDSGTKAKQKARAALACDAAKFDYLRDHMATSVVDRLYDIPRSFTHGLDLFCGSGHILRALQSRQEDLSCTDMLRESESTTTPAIKGESPLKISRLSHTDVHQLILSRAHVHFNDSSSPTSQSPSTIASVSDSHVFVESPDSSFPLPPNSVDVVLSAGGLHWVNDLPRLLSNIRRTLKPDGVFIAAMLGGETLNELRISMQLAEDQLKQRIAPRISPMIHLRDVAALLSAAGFVLPTADYERLVMSFPSMHALLTHLRGMGETNALVNRHLHYGRATFEKAASIYQERFPAANDDPNEQGNGRIEATFDIMYMIGWKAGPKQPNPKERGSASASFADISKLQT